MLQHNMLKRLFLRGARRFAVLQSDTNFSRLARNGAALLTGNTMVTVLQFVQVVVLTRLLLPEGYGTFALVTTSVLLINQFFDVRVSEMTVKVGAEYLSLGDYVRMAATIKLSYVIDFLTGLLAFGLVIGLAPWTASSILHNPDLAPLIRLYALTLLISTLDGTNNSVLRVLDRFNIISIYAVAMAVLELTAVAVAAFLAAGIRGVLIALLLKDLISAVVGTILSVWSIRRQGGFRRFLIAPLAGLRGRYRELGMFLLHTNFMAYFRMINTKADVMILGFFRPAGEVGLYKLGRQIASLIGRVSDPFYNAILPDLSRLWAQKRIGEYKRLIRQSFLSMSLLLGLVGVGIMVFKDLIIRLVAGEAYLAAGIVVVICSWAFLLGGIFFWTRPAVLSMHRPDFGTTVGLVVVAVQLMAALLLIPLLGSLGNALALLASYIVGQPLIAWLVFREISRGEREVSVAAQNKPAS